MAGRCWKKSGGIPGRFPKPRQPFRLRSSSGNGSGERFSSGGAMLFKCHLLLDKEGALPLLPGKACFSLLPETPANLPPNQQNLPRNKTDSFGCSSVPEVPLLFLGRFIFFEVLTKFFKKLI